MVREKPLPFPPEPLAWAASSSPPARWPATTGPDARNVWLRTLDRLGLGFDS